MKEREKQESQREWTREREERVWECEKDERRRGNKGDERKRRRRWRKNHSIGKKREEDKRGGGEGEHILAGTHMEVPT